MSRTQQTPAMYQRNALAPSLLAAAVLFVAPALLESDWFLAVRFVATILGLIIGWFAVQARHWWWVPVFLAIAVIWNPVFPFEFAGPIWSGAQVAAAFVFLAAGATIKVRREG
ncbi:hypothetical protein KZX37_02645 [Microbacterium sp. EYE_5]|uniref:DUF6804 family protein n=1 Tax=unclassified Microbacterium TaxID=2609290 RepID=UPI0020032C45|nr:MULTISPECIES: DUF6804 family protein [unclassified Microbacterium]MCK6079518.1 hypothetical protein [Microbacterium sp. EYE_382]MCK6084788.1 hypothetical protein [Microbacterium sp. EYE_384]MCK6122985.1 hypothetical protein [Microbacterium sp. EYE_80]MCK6125552.1 hypothetical protein [Microbacterium sp. EYE_79]MCK6140472.1 hypothetical protein [Microbacterium sp. EYE_39]